MNDDEEPRRRYWRVLWQAILFVFAAAALAVAFAHTLAAKIVVVAAILGLVAAWYLGYIAGSRSGGHRSSGPPRTR